MLNLFKKDAKVDPAELEKLRQKLSEVTSQPIAQPPPQPIQPIVIQGQNAPFQPAQSPQYVYIDPEKAEDNERITNLIMQQIKELIEIDGNLNTKIKEIEAKLVDNTNAVNSIKAAFDTHKVKMEVIDKNMEKFMGLYEIVTNRFNPFIVEEEELPKPPAKTSTVDEIRQEKKDVPLLQNEKHEEIKKVPVVEDRLSKDSPVVPNNQASMPDIKQHMSQLAEEVSQAVNAQMRQAISELSNTITAKVNAAVREQVENGGVIKELVKNAVAEELGRNLSSEPKRQKKVAKTYHFHLPNGFIVDSRQSLIDGLKSISDSDFLKYVDSSKNDFAQWIALALKEDKLAAQAMMIKSRGELIDFCERNL